MLWYCDVDHPEMFHNDKKNVNKRKNCVAVLAVVKQIIHLLIVILGIVIVKFVIGKDI